MQSLTIRPMQWSLLPDLADAAPLNAADIDCLRELRDVLARHGKLDRFAVHLAHRHFDLAPDEILIERPDAATRTQHVSVGLRSDQADAVPTTWLFDDGPEMRLSDAVYCNCAATSPYAPDSCGSHRKSPTPTKNHIEEERKKAERISREDAVARDRPIAGHDRERER